MRRDRLVVDERVDDVVQGVGDDLADRRDVPAGAQLRHELPHLLHLVVVGAADEVDELRVRRAQHRAPRDQAARLEGLAERQRARLGDDRLVEVEEGRGRAGRHGAIVGGRARADRSVHRRPCRTPLSTRAVARRVLSSGPRGNHRRHDRTAPRHPRPVPPRRAAAAGRRGRRHARRRPPTAARAARLGGCAAGAARRRRGRGDGAGSAPARRPRVYVVAWGAVPDEMFRVALAVGAESVAELPRSEAWLAELLTDLGDAEPRRAGLVVGVIGGSGRRRRDDVRVRARPGGGPPRPRRRRRRRPARSRRRPGARARGPATASGGTGCARPPAG